MKNEKVFHGKLVYEFRFLDRNMKNFFIANRIPPLSFWAKYEKSFLVIPLLNLFVEVGWKTACIFGTLTPYKGEKYGKEFSYGNG